MLDAVPLLKSDGGLALMAELAKSSSMTGARLDKWYGTLPFYKNPTLAMVKSAFVSCVAICVLW